MLLPSVPFAHPFSQIRREMDRLLSGFFWDRPDWFWPTALRGHPAVNMWETEDALHVEMEVPGVTREQLDISVVSDQVSVKVERPEDTRQDVRYHRRERPVGSFMRVLRVPTEVDAAKVEAELHNGVLTIHLPKAESARPRKIPVATAR